MKKNGWRTQHLLISLLRLKTIPVMKTNLSLFAQTTRLIPRDIIHKNVDEHDSDLNSKGIN